MEEKLKPGFYFTKFKSKNTWQEFANREILCEVTEDQTVYFFGCEMYYHIDELEYFIPLINGKRERSLWQEAVAQCMTIPEYYKGAKAVGEFVERLRKTI